MYKVESIYSEFDGAEIMDEELENALEEYESQGWVLVSASKIKQDKRHVGWTLILHKKNPQEAQGVLKTFKKLLQI